VLIDWFTLVAQIINFLLLAYLLKRFLYGPILATMHEREQRVVSRLQEADQLRAVADQSLQSYQRQQAELEQRRAALLADARREADAQREALISAARADAEALKAKWQAALERDEAAFLGTLRQRGATQVVEVARRALGDLAGAELEQRIVTIFLERMAQLDPAERADLGRILAQTSATAAMRCAFPLAETQRQQIGQALRDLLDVDVALTVEAAPDLICGISLVLSGREIGWSVQSYLGALIDEITEALRG
jgi:F-type H+-transporting ATPase subunit b